jgi:amidohydrolase
MLKNDIQKGKAMTLSKRLPIDIATLISLRQYLHAHPEVSRQEYKTSAYLQKYLQENATPDHIIKLADAGFAAIYEGASPGKTVLIRTELDALPIHEINDIEYRSIYDGIGHMCGHDGHMTIVTGLAYIYANQRPTHGRVILLYQPDEETGTGARECANHKNFTDIINPDYVFALHNFPSFPKNQILCKTKTFTSAVKFMAIKLKGKETHSAMPEKGINPAFAINEITLASQDIQKQFGTPDEYALVVPVHYNMGISSSGVAPGYGEAHYTLRTCRNDVVDEMWEALSKRATDIAKAHNLDIEFEIIEDFAASFNDAECVDMIEQTANQHDFDYLNLDVPFRGGEDFGEIIKQYKGAMFGLGSGENRPDLHNPDYDFPDDIIETGITMFDTLIKMVLENKITDNIAA